MPEIQVTLYANLARVPPGARHGRPFPVAWEEGQTLHTVLARLALPEEIVRHIFVNGRRVDLDYVPHAGDAVAVFPPLAGG